MSNVQNNSDRKGILVIQSMGLGDILFALPVLNALRRNFPGEPISFFTHEQNRSLLSLIPQIDTVLTYSRKNLSEALRVLKEIREKKFRMAVVLNPIFRGSVLAWLSQAPQRIGYLHDYERQQSLFGLQSLFLTQIARPREEKIHETERYLDILRNAGIEVRPEDSMARLQINQEGKDFFQSAVSQLKKEGDGPVVLINPGGNWDLKRWPVQRFAETALNLIESFKARVVLIGSQADIPVAAEVQRMIPHHVLNYAGKTNLPQMAGLLATGNLLITNDTGALHMAAALKVPALALFGPGDVVKFAPRSPQTTVLYHSILCSPCKYSYTDRCGNNLCIQQITVEEVVTAAAKILEKPVPSKIISLSKPAASPFRKKILFFQVTTEIGGTDISLLRTLETLDRERYEPHVLLPQEGPFVEAYRKCGAKIHFIPDIKKMTSRKGVGYIFSYLTGYWPTVLKIQNLIQKETIDLVHTNTIHNLYGFWAARLAKVPHVWHIREIVVQSRWMRLLEVFLVRRYSNRFVVMDNAIAEAFLGKTSGFPKQIRKVYEGIDIEKFNPKRSGERIRKELGIPAETPVVGMISRMDPWKGVDVFLKAAEIVHRKNPLVKFLICGGKIDGHEKYETTLKEQARSLGIESAVIFAGWRYKGEDMPEVFRALTISVQCPVNPEPYGLVNIEAMASGIPVVAPGIGGPAELCVQGETAFLVEPKNPDVTADEILRLLSDPKLAKSMGEKGRQRAEMLFDMKKCIKDLEKVYEECFQAHGK